MIPKDKLPFLKKVSEQDKRIQMIKSKRKIRNKKPYKEPSIISPTFLKNQIKRFFN